MSGYKLEYTKDDKGWTVTDELGNSAHGITREKAEHMYELIYHNVQNNGIDMRQYISFNGGN